MFAVVNFKNTPQTRGAKVRVLAWTPPLALFYAIAAYAPSIGYINTFIDYYKEVLLCFFFFITGMSHTFVMASLLHQIPN